MQISHLLPFLLILVPIFWGIYGFVVNRKGARNVLLAKQRSGWIIVVNSAILYALAFNIIFFIQELFLALGKRWLGLKAFLYHNNHNWEGTHPMEGLAQGYGAAAILITGFICLIIAGRLKSSAHWLHLFFLWMAFQGFAQSIPQFITAVFAPDTDTGQAFIYLGLSYNTGVAISIFSIVLMLYITADFSKLFLRLAPNENYTATSANRFNYIFKICLVASLIGIVLIVPFRIMPWDRAMAPVAVTIISVPMLFANAWKVKPQSTINNISNHKLNIAPIILLICVLLIFQLVLAKGIEM
jgi:hypothetical protein